MRLSSLLIATVVYTVASPIRENDETISFDDGTWDGYPAPPELSVDVTGFRCTKGNGLCCTGDDNKGDGVFGSGGETGPVLFNCLSSMRRAFILPNYYPRWYNSCSCSSPSPMYEPDYLQWLWFSFDRLFRKPLPSTTSWHTGGMVLFEADTIWMIARVSPSESIATLIVGSQILDVSSIAVIA